MDGQRDLKIIHRSRCRYLLALAALFILLLLLSLLFLLVGLLLLLLFHDIASFHSVACKCYFGQVLPKYTCTMFYQGHESA